MPTAIENRNVVRNVRLHHCDLLDEEIWSGNPQYLLPIAPRISRYNETADDAAIQCQIDIAGANSVGFFDGSMSTIGNFTALIYPETLPERVAMVSYLTELVWFYDDVDTPEPDEINIESSASNMRRKPLIKDPAWKQRSKVAFSRALDNIFKIDPSSGKEILGLWKSWRLGEKQINKRFEQYGSLEEYISDRMDDIGWSGVLATMQFGANISLSTQERASVQDVITPLLVHGVFLNDYFTWEKECRAYEQHGIPIRNSIIILMRQLGMSLAEAKVYLRKRILELGKEYCSLRDTLLESREDTISPSVRKWLKCVELTEAGYSIWILHSHRHNAAGGDGYREFYAEQLAKGVQWFDGYHESQ